MPSSRDIDARAARGARYIAIDGNEAAAYVAHHLNEVIAIYPITPSSTMGELCDAWSAEGRENLWGGVPTVIEMQSEAGAAGAVHGSLQAGALSTTFTASQGLLLMIPNMYKIAGELTSTVFHVSARSVASAALSIFGDHSDVMATRGTGFALLASSCVQEVMDFALISQAATLRGRIPVLHFFDGFRTSHEVMKVVRVTEGDMRAMIDEELVFAHRARALSPDHPVLRGSAMNPDVFFQAREAANPYYERFPAVVQQEMDRFASLTGRRYTLFDYEGAADADRVIVIMGSGGDTVAATAETLAAAGEKVGVLKVRLFRPFAAARFLAALPETVRTIAVLDRTKEPGSAGEPLYQDVVTVICEASLSGARRPAEMPRVIGGRYGLGSKEFTPAMVKAIFDEMRKDSPRNHFTVGIHDDVTGTSLAYDPQFRTQHQGTYQAVFFGLGADGTVGANKNSIKSIGESTENYAQGYFVYDSKKSGSITISHLRFGKRVIRAPYLIDQADFVACHQFHFLERYDVLRYAAPDGVFLLNSPFGPDEVWDQLPRTVQEDIIRKRLKVHVIDAYGVAAQAALGPRINTIMQTCFFAISGVMPLEKALAEIKEAVERTYGKKGEEIVRRNSDAVDEALTALREVRVPAAATSTRPARPIVSESAPEFVKQVTCHLMAGRGDDLPVSRLPCDGTFPTGTARWEKRDLAQEIPVWDPDACIQCGKCAFVCPHAAIRIKAYEEKHLASPPATFKWIDVRGKDLGPLKYTIQVGPEDCTGCGICAWVCPAKDKEGKRALLMQPPAALREDEARNYEFFLGLPELDRRHVKVDSVRGSQFLEPLFEASGACAGCGETPYLKLLSQLFGDRLLIANATGCSSIYGGNLPTTPWSRNREGRGPAWSNSLFEDNAEFGLGFRLALDQEKAEAIELVRKLEGVIGAELAESIVEARQEDEADIHAQRLRVDDLRAKLLLQSTQEARRLLSLASALVEKSVWIVGGDGWAYDIGFGGLDHVLSSGRNVKVLVLDTEVYSNTGGQMSKSTPRGAVAKFAAAGKRTPKKDLGLLAMQYENVYVAQIAMGASDVQTVRSLIEAERHRGPALVLAYSHCIAHGIDMRTALDDQKAAVRCGHWPLYRYDPAETREGSALKVDSKAPDIAFADYASREDRFKALERNDPAAAKELRELAEEDIRRRWSRLQRLARPESDRGTVTPPKP